MTCCVYNAEDTVPLDSLLRHVVVAIPDVPYEVALDMLRQRYTELCRKSGILSYEYELPIQRGVDNYFLLPPEGYEVYRITGIATPYPSAFVGPSPHRWFAYWGYEFNIIENKQVVFRVAPSRDEKGRTIWLGLLPTPCVSDIPSSIATLFGRALAEGVIADILMLPNRPYTNPELARRYERSYNIGVMAARNMMITERGAKPAQFRPVRIL